MASSVFSNYEEVRDALKSLGSSWDFRGRGKWRTLGEDALDVVAVGIIDRTERDQKQPDGAPLAELKPATLRRKLASGYPETIGVESGEMLSYEEVAGVRQITRRLAVMDYGTTEATRLRAAVFSEGRAGVQAPRPFYELDEKIEANLDRLFEEILETNIREQGGN